jgi:hypothetical protein
LPNIQRPIGRDVTKRNSPQVLYIKGNEFLDGSERINFNPQFNEVKFERRDKGVWNLAPLGIGSETLSVGNNLNISAVGEWLDVIGLSESVNGLAVIVGWDATGTDEPRAAVLGALQERVVIQGDDSEEQISKIIIDINTSPIAALRPNIYWRTGSVAATAPIVYSLQVGSLLAPVFYRLTISPIDFPANTEIKINLPGQVDFPADVSIFSRLASDEIFSLKGNLAGNRWLALDLQPEAPTPVLAFGVNEGRFVSDQAGDFVADQNGDIVWAGPGLAPLPT